MTSDIADRLPLQGRRIVLGVTGSISAFKAADLTSKLRQAGAEVEVIMTPSATEFVTPLTVPSLRGRAAAGANPRGAGDGHADVGAPGDAGERGDAAGEGRHLRRANGGAAGDRAA